MICAKFEQKILISYAGTFHLKLGKNEFSSKNCKKNILYSTKLILWFLNSSHQDDSFKGSQVGIWRILKIFLFSKMAAILKKIHFWVKISCKCDTWYILFWGLENSFLVLKLRFNPTLRSNLDFYIVLVI